MAETPAASTAEVTQTTTEAAPDTGANTQAEATAQAIAELQDGDFDKLIPIKDENGQVIKVKVKDLVKETYATRTKAKRAEQAIESKVKSTVQELVNYAKTNPADFMQRIGLDPYQFSEMTLTEKVKALEMTPEQRRVAELEAKAREYEEKVKKYEQEQLKSKEQIEFEKAQTSLDQEVTEAFQKSGLPKSKFFVQMALAQMHNDLVRYETEVAEKGFADREPLSAAEAFDIVKQSVPNLIGEYIGSLDANQLKQLLGKKFDELKTEDIKRLQNQEAAKTPSIEKPAKKEKEPVFHRDSEYRAWVESRKLKS